MAGAPREGCVERLHCHLVWNQRCTLRLQLRLRLPRWQRVFLQETGLLAQVQQLLLLLLLLLQVSLLMGRQSQDGRDTRLTRRLTPASWHQNILEHQHILELPCVPVPSLDRFFAHVRTVGRALWTLVHRSGLPK